MQQKKLTTNRMVFIALMTAATCILAPWSIVIPWSPAPISLTNFIVYLTIYLLGLKFGTFSYLLYLLLGLVGLPVFSGFSGGIGKLFGPTGGYLIGMIFMAVVSGLFLDVFPGKDVNARLLQISGMILGSAVNYAFGTAWLAHMAGMSFGAALAAGVLPFIPGDLIKILLAALLGPELRCRLLRAGLV